VKQTWLGLSSFTYPYACGIHPTQRPEQLLTPIQLIEKAQELQVNCVQFSHNMPLDSYSDEELDHIRDYAVAHGIMLENGMRCMTPERLHRYIQISDRMHIPLLRIITDGAGYEPTVEEITSILSDAIPFIEKTGVVLGIENHDRLQAREYADIVEQVDHPQVGLVVDSTNSLSTEETIEEVLKWMAPHCVCFHLKDYTIKRSNSGIGLAIVGACAGTGRLPIPAVLDYLRKHAKRDFSTVLESWMECCATLEETLAQEEAWAKASVAYVKSLL